MSAKCNKGIYYLAVFLGLALICGRAPAQIITGEMSGTVTDASGAVVPGATVTVTNEGTGAARTAESGSNGEFVITALPPGQYSVKVEKAGFQASERKGIALTANQRVALGDLPLSIGQVTQTVEVQAQGEVVNTESADAVGLLSNIQVDNLGVKGRDVMQLLRVLPGVSTLTVVPWGEISDNDPAGTGANGGQFGSFTPAVGGARLFWNTVTVDGQVGSNPDFPGLFMAATSIDAVAEVKIVSNNYTADYGRNPGSTIAVITKSGTRDFHGTVYGYKRHEMFNANDFFNNRDGIEKSVYRFGTFGFAVGGPVYIPNKFNSNREKLFFFYSQENWRVKQPQGITTVTVPTALERAGDFSQSIFQGTVDENTGQPIPVQLVDPDPANPNPIVNNVIPQARLNSQGQVLMNVMPLPNRSDPFQPFNYEWRDICEIPRLLQALKLDYHPSTKDTFVVSGRRWWVDTRAYGCRVLGFADDLPIFKHHYAETTDTVQVAWTRIVSPTIVNEFNIGMVGEKELSPATNLFGRTAANYFDPIKRSTLGFTLGQLYPGANTNDILPQAYFDGVPNGAYLNTEDRFPDNQGYPRFNFADNLSWIRGSHTFKFGVYFERSWATDGPHAGCFNGCFNFSHDDPNNPFNTGFAFANAALGTFTSYSESDSRKFYLMANKVLEWFAQDTYKVTPKLTLTYGARFAWFTPWKVNKGLGAEFVESRYDPTQVPPLYFPVDVGGSRRAVDPTNAACVANPTVDCTQPEVFIGAYTGPMSFPGMVLSSDSSYPAGFRKQQPVQVSPRFGFSYDPFGNGKTAIRGGFAVMKEATPSYGTYTWSMVTNPPVQLHPNIYYGTMDTLLSRSGLLFPGGSSAIELDDHVPSVYRYSLGIQRDVGFNTIVDVSYVGNVGRHLIQGQDQNAIPYGARFLPANQDPTTGSALPATFYRRIPGYEGIGMLMNSGISNYNALQTAINRRFTKGLSFGISYTWSHTLNTGSSEGDSIAAFRPWRIWNYGPANFDQTHMFIFNYVWDLPKPSNLVDGSTSKLVVGSILDNWQVSGVATMASGLPQGIGIGTISGLDLSGGGDGTRVDVVARPQLSHGARTFDRWFNTEAFAMPAVPDLTDPNNPIVDPGNAPIFPVRGPGQNNWDITLMKKFPLKSETRSLQFRFEFYNAWNHTQFSSIDTFALFDDTTAGFPQVNNTFGQVTGSRQPRVIQLSVRLDF
ncbi:MAG: carboxypeptidase regulatory-like domain-containing protein [Terriglobia bacterium]